MSTDTTISRARYESLIVLAITGWGAALFLFGFIIGASK